jgi:hypothetical protein
VKKFLSVLKFKNNKKSEKTGENKRRKKTKSKGIPIQEYFIFFKEIDWIKPNQFITLFVGTLIFGIIATVSQHQSSTVLQEAFRKGLELIKW